MQIKILVFLSLLAVTVVTIILGLRTTPIHPSLQQASDTDQQPGGWPSDSQSSEVNQDAPKLQFSAAKARSISPTRLARIINSNKRKWDKHQVSEELDLQQVWNSLRIPSDDLQQCQANCQAQVFPVTLTGRPGEILLKVTNFDFCRYLAFRQVRTGARSQTAWRFLGHIDHAFNKYEMSWHRIIALGNKHWLVIRGQTGSGTGFSSYDDTWYEVSEKGIKAVLHYTARAHIAQWPKGIGWELKSTIVTGEPASERSVTVKFRVACSGLNYMTEEYPFLFPRSRVVRFKWDSRQRRFVLVPGATEELHDEFESMFQPHSWSEESFVRFNLSQLISIAKRRNSKQREWLRDFVRGYKDSSEKTRLLQALGQ